MLTAAREVLKIDFSYKNILSLASLTVVLLTMLANDCTNFYSYERGFYI